MGGVDAASGRHPRKDTGYFSCREMEVRQLANYNTTIRFSKERLTIWSSRLFSRPVICLLSSEHVVVRSAVCCARTQFDWHVCSILGLTVGTLSIGFMVLLELRLVRSLTLHAPTAALLCCRFDGLLIGSWLPCAHERLILALFLVLVSLPSLQRETRFSS